MTSRFADSVFEVALKEAEATQRHLVVRFYLEYPTKETGVPEYLRNGLTMVEHSDHGGGVSPDYTNSTLIDAMVSFIAAFGEQYNGDQRLGCVVRHVAVARAIKEGGIRSAHDI